HSGAVQPADLPDRTAAHAARCRYTAASGRGAVLPRSRPPFLIRRSVTESAMHAQSFRRLMRARAAVLVASLPCIAAGAPASAQDAWPSRAVTIVVPFGAGNAYDQMVRFLAEKLREQTGQPFVVEARQGALGSVAASHVARAAPDGHTIFFGANSTHAANV